MNFSGKQKNDFTRDEHGQRVSKGEWEEKLEILVERDSQSRRGGGSVRSYGRGTIT